MAKFMCVKSVAVVLTVMLIYFMLQGCSRVKHYESHHDCESLYSVLYHQVKEGDSKERVEELLGSGKIPSPADKKKLLSAHKKLAQKFPQEYTDGVEDSDEFLGYGCGTVEGSISEIFYLQFRGGKLIYHREDFKKYRPVEVLSASPAK